MCFFASSKLLPRTVRDNSAQLPLQLSSSGQKRHSKGTETLTCTFTARGCITLLHSEEPWPKGEITGSSSCGSMSLYRNSDLCWPVYASHYGDATYGAFELFLTALQVCQVASVDMDSARRICSMLDATNPKPIRLFPSFITSSALPRLSP